MVKKYQILALILLCSINGYLFSETSISSKKTISKNEMPKRKKSSNELKKRKKMFVYEEYFDNSLDHNSIVYDFPVLYSYDLYDCEKLEAGYFISYFFYAYTYTGYCDDMELSSAFASYLSIYPPYYYEYYYDGKLSSMYYADISYRVDQARKTKCITQVGYYSDCRHFGWHRISGKKCKLYDFNDCYIFDIDKDYYDMLIANYSTERMMKIREKTLSKEEKLKEKLETLHKTYGDAVFATGIIEMRSKDTFSFSLLDSSSTVHQEMKAAVRYALEDALKKFGNTTYVIVKWFRMGSIISESKIFIKLNKTIITEEEILDAIISRINGEKMEKLNLLNNSISFSDYDFMITDEVLKELRERDKKPIESGCISMICNLSFNLFLVSGFGLSFGLQHLWKSF